AGLVTLPSAHSAAETVERLKALLAKKGIQLFAHIDHAAEAKKVGLRLRPTQVFIFGNPPGRHAPDAEPADHRAGLAAASPGLGRRSGKSLAHVPPARLPRPVSPRCRP